MIVTKVVDGTVAMNSISKPGSTSTMGTQGHAVADAAELVKKSNLYREFLAEREEILKHKWIESEKAGYDIGFERALTDWIVRHRAKWRKARQLASQQS